MAVPRNRLSNARKNSKRAHHAKRPINTTNCNNCKGFTIPHTICAFCGFYDNCSTERTKKVPSSQSSAE